MEKSKKIEGGCMDLALEGERLCKVGDCRSGVQYFEAAVQVGTDDLKTLSAIYSQLGNAYFYLQEYGKALEYHKHDLNLARTIGDKLGEAKASGNLGNTLKVLGKFEEAIACCQRHLDISRELADKIGEARALYNLGNVYHSKGKHAGNTAHQDPGEFPPDVKESLGKAAEYYEINLNLVRDLGDRAAQGRACGNLGNTHYLLGNFSTAIKYHEERLTIAREFGDKSAERRAYSNLGNAHIFLGNFEVAADHYKMTLNIAKQLGDRALEAQACYSLGNTYTLLRDYEKALEYHMQHLLIAQELSDRMGEGRACWSIGNAHAALGKSSEALEYAKKHLEISKEIGDQMGMATAQLNLQDLRSILGIRAPDEATDNVDSGSRRPAQLLRRQSMEQLELMKLTPDKASEKNAATRPKVTKSYSVATELPQKMMENRPPSEQRRVNSARGRPDSKNDDDDFFDQLSRYQSRRIDDQRCDFDPDNKENATPPPQEETDFLEMLAGIQGSRMNDQRAELPTFPGLNNQEAVIGPMLANRNDENDDFFEMLMRCQSSRIESQRSSLPEVSAPTVPDEDFFSLIMRVQSDRLDEQRSSMPESRQVPLPHLMPPKPAPVAAPAAVEKRPSKKNKKGSKK